LKQNIEGLANRIEVYLLKVSDEPCLLRSLHLVLPDPPGSEFAKFTADSVLQESGTVRVISVQSIGVESRHNCESPLEAPRAGPVQAEISGFRI
jgi:hypothetical protein